MQTLIIDYLIWNLISLQLSNLFYIFYVEYYQVVRYDVDRGDWKSSGDRYCGRQLPQPIATYSEKVRLIFRSNQDIIGEGFKVIYWID